MRLCQMQARKIGEEKATIFFFFLKVTPFVGEAKLERVSFFPLLLLLRGCLTQRGANLPLHPLPPTKPKMDQPCSLEGSCKKDDCDKSQSNATWTDTSLKPPFLIRRLLSSFFCHQLRTFHSFSSSVAVTYIPQRGKNHTRDAGMSSSSARRCDTWILRQRSPNRSR